jgi:hypothetical protein
LDWLGCAGICGQVLSYQRLGNSPF